MARITTEELARYFEAKNVDTACSRCRSNEWILGEDQGVTARLPVAKGSTALVPDLLNRSIRLVLLICSNCGHVELISRALVLDWLGREDSGDG